MSGLRGIAHESARYLGASALALALDSGTFIGLHRLAGLDYRIAAPLGFLLGLALIYGLSIRWVFGHRRLKDARAEFVLFAALGLAGLVLNQAIITIGMEFLGLPDWAAKIASAGIVFGFNFGSRKLLLFTRY